MLCTTLHSMLTPIILAERIGSSRKKKKIPAYSLGWYLLMILLYSDVLFTCLVLLARLCDGTISSQQKRYPIG